ncbi:F-box domain containing protein [Tanacetum coccineum]|uniref:F-box domain containing protein n=1 Tax=Tanacetum coccineum TaxID=301880 RepID=A0ABQ4YGT4_9ASTR
MEKNKIIKEDATDRISELPECIIENILLRLDKPKERVRVSVLSKKWFALTASVPVLKFLFSDFVDEEDWISSRDVRENFYKYVKYTVSRFCRQQNVKIAHTFKLLTVAGDKNEFYIIHDCVELILMRGVKVLDICVKKNRTSKCRLLYRLPNILSSVSTLTSLKISQCVVLPSSLMVGVVNFKSLKVLWLTSIPLDPLVIKHLTASCPLLEELVVDRCYGFKKFCVYGGLQSLKTLRFMDYNGIETIDIEAPNLCECVLSVGQGRSATSVILGPCKQLRTLYLDGPLFLTVGFSDFLSNFPVLENLSLCLVNRRNILAVSSPSLRNFVLYDECDLEEIDINTPNLRLFSYSNSWNCSKGEFDIKSDLGELETRMECHIFNKVDTLWLLKLRRFLEKADRFKFLKLIDLYERLSVDSEQLKGTQLPPYELEHVELKMPITHVLSDGLLWCFHPRSLSLTSGFSGISDAERTHFLKCISKRLIQQDQGPINIRIEWSIPSKAKIYFSWSSMYTTLTFHEMTQTITFRKEEGPDTDDGQKWRKKYQRRRVKQVLD